MTKYNSHVSAEDTSSTMIGVIQLDFIVPLFQKRKRSNRVLQRLTLLAPKEILDIFTDDQEQPDNKH